ncbi:MAG: hypothetical protein R6U85_10270 [Salinivirgaceae bacterium]
MKPIERVKKIIDYYGISIAGFEKKIKVSNNSIQIALKRNTSLKDETLIKILEAFPDVSPMWLLIGDGEMFKDNRRYAVTNKINTVNESESLYNNTEELLMLEKDKRIEELLSHLKDKDRYVKILEKQLGI